MTVYVDDMEAAYGRMKMCHMIADTSEELLSMARAIEVNTKWIQYPGTYKEHFDIAMVKRKLAIQNGAVEITWRQCGMMCANRRKSGVLGNPDSTLRKTSKEVTEDSDSQQIV